jgi:hypothetical protein
VGLVSLPLELRYWSYLVLLMVVEEVTAEEEEASSLAA